MNAVETAPTPSSATLGRLLAPAFGSSSPLGVVRRAPNPYASTFPSEIVTLAVGDETFDVLCKYDLPWARDVRGHPAGPLYEGEVYRLAVGPSGLTAPRFLGIHADAESASAWLAVEFVAQSHSLVKAPDEGALARAAAWIGAFHRFHVDSDPLKTKGLNRHDEAYFAGCVERTQANTASLRADLPWLSALATWFLENAVPLLTARCTVAHGDYYPSNVLLRKGVVYPIDWERATVSAGEIDLAAVIEGHWLPGQVRAAVEEYARARWPAARPHDFSARLAAARLHLHFRALGGDPAKAFEPGAAWRFEQMRLAAQEAGVL